MNIMNLHQLDQFRSSAKMSVTLPDENPGTIYNDC